MNFWRSKHWLEYLLNSKIGTAYTDRSFYMDKTLVPLIQDGCELYSPGFDDDKAILEYVKELALQHGIKRIQVDSQIKSYLNISGYTCIIDPANISPSKGHKSAIKKGQKFLTYEIVTETGQFMRDYFEIAGRQTRPERTFELLGDWIKLGYGTLLRAKFEDKTAGYVYLLHYGDYAYYFMSGVYEQYKYLDVSHYLQSVAFDILRDKGVTRYELGDQAYNGLFYQPSEKERNISKFKRNFGGEIVIKPKSEYFFDAEYFRDTMQKRINGYINAELL